MSKPVSRLTRLLRVLAVTLLVLAIWLGAPIAPATAPAPRPPHLATATTLRKKLEQRVGTARTSQYAQATGGNRDLS